ncbi:hypothetical protein SSCG_04498 [Streptomyces clavuligerus]|nr:hypothetical protein SSCG_04498 [Streptomyces clavuligerus]
MPRAAYWITTHDGCSFFTVRWGRTRADGIRTSGRGATLTSGFCYLSRRIRAPDPPWISVCSFTGFPFGLKQSVLVALVGVGRL